MFVNGISGLKIWHLQLKWLVTLARLLYYYAACNVLIYTYIAIVSDAVMKKN